MIAVVVEILLFLLLSLLLLLLLYIYWMRSYSFTLLRTGSSVLCNVTEYTATLNYLSVCVNKGTSIVQIRIKKLPVFSQYRYALNYKRSKKQYIHHLWCTILMCVCCQYLNLMIFLRITITFLSAMNKPGSVGSSFAAGQRMSKGTRTGFIYLIAKY